MSKYKNQKCEYDGLTFDSKRELARYCELKVLLKAGAIRNLERQVKFEIIPSVILDGKKKPARKYIADFVYEERTGELERVYKLRSDIIETREKWNRVIEDVKGMRTPMYAIKRHLMMARHGIEVREV